MSRSRRKTPITGMTTADSDKPFKVQEHRRERRTVRAVLPASLSTDDRRLHTKAYGTANLSEKDGKGYLRRPAAKDMRK